MLESISRTARIIQADDPGFLNTFHSPERKGAQAVLTAARLFARDIEAVAKQFVDHGMPETMVADFKGALEAYEHAVRRREIGKGETAAARASIEAALDRALAEVRRLDVIVANQMRDDSVTLAEWARDRQVPYPRHAATPAIPAVPAPEPAVPTTEPPVPHHVPTPGVVQPAPVVSMPPVADFS